MNHDDALEHANEQCQEAAAQRGRDLAAHIYETCAAMNQVAVLTHCNVSEMLAEAKESRLQDEANAAAFAPTLAATCAETREILAKRLDDARFEQSLAAIGIAGLVRVMLQYDMIAAPVKSLDSLRQHVADYEMAGLRIEALTPPVQSP